MPLDYQVWVAALLVVSGLVACFAGYRLFRLVLAVYGFILGALIGTSLAGAGSTTGMLVAGAVGGLVGALVLVLAYFVGVALVGAGLGAFVAHVAWTSMASEPPVWVVILLSVAGAFGAMALQRYVIIVGTALGGAWTLIVGGLALAGDRTALSAASSGDVWVVYPLDPSPGQRWLLVAWAVLALTGLVAQLSQKKKRKS